MLNAPSRTLDTQTADVTTLLTITEMCVCKSMVQIDFESIRPKGRKKKTKGKSNQKNYPYQNDVDNSCMVYAGRTLSDICCMPICIHLNYWRVWCFKHTESGCSSTSFASKYVVTDVKIVVFSMGQIFLRQSIWIIIKLAIGNGTRRGHEIRSIICNKWTVNSGLSCFEAIK